MGDDETQINFNKLLISDVGCEEKKSKQKQIGISLSNSEGRLEGLYCFMLLTCELLSPDRLLLFTNEPRPFLRCPDPWRLPACLSAHLLRNKLLVPCAFPKDRY